MKKPDTYKKIDGRSCRQVIEGLEYEVNNTNPSVCYRQRNKQQRIEEFKTFLFLKFQERWNKIPKPVATLEKQYIKETLNSL